MDWSSLGAYIAAYMGVFAAGVGAGAAHAWVRRIVTAI